MSSSTHQTSLPSCPPAAPLPPPKAAAAALSSPSITTNKRISRRNRQLDNSSGANKIMDVSSSSSTRRGRPTIRRVMSNDGFGSLHGRASPPKRGIRRTKTSENMTTRWMRTSSHGKGMTAKEEEDLNVDVASTKPDSSSVAGRLSGSTQTAAPEAASSTATTATKMTSGLLKSPEESDNESEDLQNYLPPAGDFSWRSAVPQRLLDQSSSHSRLDAAAVNNRLSSTRDSSKDDTLLTSLSNHLREDTSSDFHLSFMTATLKNGDKNYDSEAGDLDSSSEGLHRAPRTKLSDYFAGKSNLFQTREDLRQVDQSVNLMDVETAKYEESQRGTSSSSKKRNFFGGLWRKDSNHKLNKRGQSGGGGFGSLSFLLIVALLAAAMLIAYVMTPYAEETRLPWTTAPTMAPQGDTPHTNDNLDAKRMDELDFLLSTVDPQFHMASASSAATEAMAWISTFDPVQLPLTSTLSFKNGPAKVVDRFVLATLFFATHNEFHANSTNFEHQHHQEEAMEDDDSQEKNAGRRQLLIRNHLEHWMSSRGVCEWEGIQCHHDQLTGISLGGAHLQGTIPPEISFLSTKVEAMDLSDNRLEGALPESMQQLTLLKSLRLDNNLLSGDISSMVCPLKDRQHNLKFLSSDCNWRVECDCCNECY